MEATPGNFITTQGLGAALHQCIGAHIVIGADHEPTQRIYQSTVSVATVAWPEQISDQRLQLTISKFLVQEGEKLLLLVRADVVQIIDCFGLFEPAEIFFVVRQARVIKYNHLNRMAITPEML